MGSVVRDISHAVLGVWVGLCILPTLLEHFGHFALRPRSVSASRDAGSTPPGKGAEA